MLVRSKLFDSLLADERALLSASLWSGLLLIDGIVWSRRLSGAMTIPLSAPVVWASSLIVAAAAIGALIGWRETQATRLSRTEWRAELLTLMTPLTWGLAVAQQTSPLTWGGLAALWSVLVVSVGLVSLWFPQGEAAQLGGELASDVAGVLPTLTAHDEMSTERSPATHSQRRILVDGMETIEGEATVEFLPGQKEAFLHLSFCPPFSGLPELHGEDALGGDSEIRAEAVHPFGARLSIRRASGIEAAESRQVSYVANLPATDEAAA